MSLRKTGQSVMGSNNGVVYSFHVRHGKLVNNLCYKQLLYSISTLRAHNKTTPIKVYISPKTVDTSESKLDTLSNVEVIKFDNHYPSELLNKEWVEEGHAEFLYHRWKNAFRTLAYYGFDQILYLDTDTVFYNDLYVLFKKYNGKMVWAREDNTYDVMSFLNLDEAMNDGQFILNKLVLDHLSNFDDTVISFINKSLDKCKDNFDRDAMRFKVRWIMIQYALYTFFKELGHPVAYFDHEDVALHSEKDEPNDQPILRHYYSSNSEKYLPKEFK
jgi:hypothetical protein